MFSDLRIYVIIGIFMILCSSLLIYNFAVIRYAKGKYTGASAAVKRLKTKIYEQAIIISGDATHLKVRHERHLIRKLSNPENLVLYSLALSDLKNEFPDSFNTYISERGDTFIKLGGVYSRKSVIERTCFADFIGDFHQVVGDSVENMAEILVSYIDNSGIYCRTKVLDALCGIGSLHGVATAISIFNEKSLFVNSLVLAKAFLSFNGDLEVLCAHLWNMSKDWNDDLKTAVIWVITDASSKYEEEFRQMLDAGKASPKVRDALKGYFNRARTKEESVLNTVLAAQPKSSEQPKPPKEIRGVIATQ